MLNEDGSKVRSLSTQHGDRRVLALYFLWFTDDNSRHIQGDSYGLWSWLPRRGHACSVLTVIKDLPKTSLRLRLTPCVARSVKPSVVICSWSRISSVHAKQIRHCISRRVRRSTMSAFADNLILDSLASSLVLSHYHRAPTQR